MYGYDSGAVVFGYIIGLIVLLVVKGLLASNASDIAQDKGYEKRKWFHMCFWLSLPAYLIVCAMPDKNLTEAMRQQFTGSTGKNAGNLEATALAAKQDTYVTFGHYPQMAEGNDNTAIEWIVLQKEGNKALLISRYGLDAQPYNAEYTKDVTWETCTLRTWLNDTFMNKAFTEEEQKAILTANVDNSSIQGYSGWSTHGGNNTQDQIFLLSYAGTNKYFDVTYSDDNNTKARVQPTAYAEKQGAYTSSSNKTADGDNAGWWWLRSPGDLQRGAALVSSAGSRDYYVSYDSGCVRPALWVNLESGIF